ncbi:MAG: putative bifunctional diguanylate cyclase/phosphodiesterase [Microthrixaceae bacterium]
MGQRSVQVLHFVLLAAAAVLAALRARTEDRWSWGPVAVFLAVTAVCQARWTLAGVYGGPEGSGDWADPLYVVGMVIGIIGMARYLFRPLAADTRWRIASDGLVVGLTACFALWTFLFEPQYTAMDARARSLQQPRLGFVLVDVTVFGVLLMAAIYQGRRPVLAWVAATSGMFSLADAAYAVHAGSGADGPATFALAAWTMCTMCIVVATVAPDGPAGDQDVTAPRRLVVYGAMSLALVALTWQVADDGQLDDTTLALLVAMSVAVLANQLFVNLELRALHREGRRSLELAEANERRFRAVFEHAPVGMSITHPDGTVVAANRAVEQLLRLDLAPPGADNVNAMLTPEEQAARDRDVAAVVSGEQDSITRRIPVRGLDGGQLDLEVTVASYPDDAGQPQMVSIVADVTEREASRARLEYLATHDPLTGLVNRHEFARLLNAGLAGIEDGRPAVAFLDLDRFKVINDSLGHEEGDRLLVEVAARLADAVEGAGTVARFGGDEFALLLHPAGRDEVDAVLDRVLAAVAHPVELSRGERFHPTVSIGVATARPDLPVEALLSEADAAMYRAKERGRNRAEWFVPSGRHHARVTLRLVDELHRALEDEELALHFQPIADRASGHVVAFEALLRWNHPRRGVLLPAHFMEVAEESGLVVPIGEWVLQTACARAARWPQVPGTGAAPSVSVNVAARQLTDPRLTDVVGGALLTSGLPADRLILEVTETALMTDARAAADTLRSLRGFGLHLSLDDFGTGYSSLTYLKRFPFGSLKIDKGFVSGLGVDADDTAIVEGVIGLARSLGLTTVAEGVESALQLRALGAMGCDRVQGYLIGRPEPTPAIEEGLTDGSLTDDAGGHR